MNNKIHYSKLNLNLKNIKEVIKLFFKKKSPIRIFHNIYLQNIKTKGVTVDLGSGRHSSYLNYIKTKHNKIYFADKIYNNSENLLNIDLEKKLRIPDNKFDTVLFNVLEHIENYKNLIFEISELKVTVTWNYIRPTHKYLEQIIMENGLKVEKLVLIGVGPLSVTSEIILKYLKFNIIKIPVFFILILLDNIIKYFSKDYKDYYLGVHCSCKK